MADGVPILGFDTVVEKLIARREPFWKNYFAMYSSWYGGIITDPALMFVPVDDHLVHRGDGIFEALKCAGGMLYNVERHLDRLERSAKTAQLTLPMSRADLTRIIVATIRASARRDCIVRLFVSRGPGGFSTNPYECPAAQLYIVITAPLDPPREVYERGVTLLTSKVPMKPGAFATCKSCNYLQNVLMKKEAVDAGVDFTVSIDEEGGLGEGSTENIGIITKNREFLVPRFDRVLRGTTLARLMELAAPLVAAGELARVAEADLTHEDAFAAAEMLIVGTGPDILPVRSFDGRAIGAGTPGPVFWRLLAVIREDIAKGPCSLPVFEGGAGGA